MSWKLVAVAVACIGWANFAAGADEKLSREEIDRAVQDLGDNSIEVREAASNALWKAGKLALPALEAAAKTADDREVRTRAKSVAEKVRFGITPDTSPEQARRILEYRASDFPQRQAMLQQFVASGEFDIALRLLESEDDDARAALTNQLLQILRNQALPQLRTRNSPQADKLLAAAATIDRSLDSACDYALYLLASGTLEDAIAKRKKVDEHERSPADKRILAAQIFVSARSTAAKSLREARDEAAEPIDLAATGDAGELRIRQQLLLVIQQAAESAIIEKRTVAADKLLCAAARFDGSLAGARNYAAFVIVGRKLPETIGQMKDSGNYKADSADAAVLAVLLASSNKPDEAREVAQFCEQGALAIDLDYRAQRWKELAAREPLPSIAHQTVLLTLSGNAPELEKRIVKLREMSKAKGAATAGVRSVRPLIFAERWPEAMEIMRADYPGDACDLFWLQKRYAEGFRALGLEDFRHGAAEWAAAQFKDLEVPPVLPHDSDQARDVSPLDLKWTPPFERVLAVAVQLFKLGEKDKARQLFALLENTPPDQQLRRHPQLLAAVYQAGLRDEAMQLFASLMEAGHYPPPFVLEAIFPKGRKVAGFWWECFRTWSPEDDSVVRLQKVRTVLGTSTAGYAPKDWTLAELMTEAEKVATKLSDGDRLDGLSSMAETCVQKGDSALGRKYFTMVAATAQQLDAAARSASSQPKAEAANPPAPKEPGAARTFRIQFEANVPTVTRVQGALIRVGDVFAKDKQWQQAAQAYQRAWQVQRQNGLPLFMQGFALGKAGDTDAGRELMHQASAIPLANTARRAKLAEDLDFRGLKEQALQQWLLCVNLGGFESFSDAALSRPLEAAARAVRSADPLKSGDLYLRFAMFMNQENVGVSLKDYGRILHLAHAGRAVGLMKAERWDEAQAAIEAAQNVTQADVDFIEQAVELLEKADRKPAAERLFDSSYQLSANNLRDFPNSAEDHNHMAWLAARCNRRLDEAKSHAEEAVRLAPEKAGYIDTLAEVYFRQGDTKMAIEHQRRAIDKAPTDVRLQAQLKRFLEAK